MAAILAARKLSQLGTVRPSPAVESAIADAVVAAERIMQRIDGQWPDRIDNRNSDVTRTYNRR